MENANAGVLSAKECIQGQGDGCLEMSGENELIRSLQERSLANKDRNERVSLVFTAGGERLLFVDYLLYCLTTKFFLVCLLMWFQEAKEAFYMKNYPDWFATVGKIMIKKSDGSFIVVDAEEAATLQKEGRLQYETPRSKGGTLIDYTQKPILVLKD